MNTGTWSIKQAGDSALSGTIALVTAVTMAQTDPAGNIGALARGIHRDAITKLISVVDFGRGDVSAWAHSSNNNTRILAVLNALSGLEKITFAISGENATSAQFVVQDGDGNPKQGDLNPYLNTDDPPVDDRTEAQIAFAVAIGEPSIATFTASSLIAAIDRVLTEIGKEGFLLCNEQDQTFKLFIVSDTSGTSNFQTTSGVSSIDATSFLGVYHVEPTAAPASGTVL